MLKRLLLAALLFGAFFYGLTQLFLLRFQSGEVYPIYCSLRADPLGTKAFADSLRELPHLSLRRNYTSITKVHADTPITLFYAGTPHQAWWQDDELRHVEELAISGSRIVISFLPVDHALTGEEAKDFAEAEKRHKELREEKRTGKKETKPEEKKDADKKKKDPKKDEEVMPLTMFSFNEVAGRWGFAFRYFPKRGNDAPPRRAKAVEPADHLEADLSWHSALNFGQPTDKWHALYSIEGSAVVIERRFGAGSIVLASDSFFLSNEALRNERSPRLLAWLVGSSRTVVFDEESHGVRENPGVATLVRKYGLHGVAGGLLLIAALFVWKNASHLVPPPKSDDSDGDLIRGREASEGLIHLLRRSIEPSALLAVCAGEWKKAFDPDGTSLKTAHLEKVIAAETARPAREQNPVEAYKTIAQVLSQKK